MIFSERRDLLNLYNAINGSDYKDPEELQINTISDAIYMGMKNDVSFLIDSCLNLYEAQSTWNPNMPLRGLFYFSRLYEGYIAQLPADLYSSNGIQIPTPRFIVFYNGLPDKEDRLTIRLSDSFLNRETEEPALECVATLININFGHNEQLMKDCRKLYEYSFLVAELRENMARYKDLPKAAAAAIKTCIREGVLADFLARHRAEVTGVILSEYNEEFHIKCEKKLSYAEGFRDAIAQLDTFSRRLLDDGRFKDLELSFKDEKYREQLLDEYGLTIEVPEQDIWY